MENDEDDPTRGVESNRTLVAIEEREVSGLRLGGEPATGFADPHHNSLQQYHNQMGSGLHWGNSQEQLQQPQPLEGGSNDCLIERNNGQLDLNAQLNISRPSNDQAIAYFHQQERHDANMRRSSSFAAADKNAMEADEDMDGEIESPLFDQEAEWSDDYPIVSSPGSSHSSKQLTSLIDAQPPQECYAKMESDMLARIEESICRAEEIEWLIL
ncbi:hypothetical protein FisN_17Hu204 [Fistulifera solaris]|jgi:hypothetical protein|uniref:Uncharacterized protein n=1 Tax=Fistulifera solaris TaxID=1519565 RepID=A0A1Z5JH63_FISSO|nr:hypothetical protein FisN_17Hu204 [Fistulifera solaris]|eukprot:GAX13266.1 hypothetical protein FisN_17Hu204 [Fistulifera solaris]